MGYGDGRWIVLRHAEVVAAATDPATFSSRVMARRAIPNSLDGTGHAAYSAVVDRHFADERVAREVGQCRGHAIAIVDALPRGVTVTTIASIGICSVMNRRQRRCGRRCDGFGTPGQASLDLVSGGSNSKALVSPSTPTRSKMVGASTPSVVVVTDVASSDVV